MKGAGHLDRTDLHVPASRPEVGRGRGTWTERTYMYPPVDWKDEEGGARTERTYMYPPVDWKDEEGGALGHNGPTCTRQ